MRFKKIKAYARETDLAADAVAWLKMHGWDVYQEIAGIDIVARKNSLVWALEVKLSLNLKVLSQAVSTKPHSNFSSIVVPSKFYDKQFEFGCYVAHSLGLGVIMCDHNNVREKVSASMRNKTTSSLEKWFNDKAHDYCPAGSSGGSSWTPFKQTIENLVKLIKEQGPMKVSQAISTVSHHYKSNQSASNSLSKLINQGIEPHLFLKVNDKIKFFCYKDHSNKNK